MYLVGLTGSDIAVELSRHCPKVYLAARSGAYVFPRTIFGMVGCDKEADLRG